MASTCLPSAGRRHAPSLQPSSRMNRIGIQIENRLDQLATFRLRSRRSLQQAAAVASGCTLAPLLPSHQPFPPLFPSLSPPLDVFRSRTLLPPGPRCLQHISTILGQDLGSRIGRCSDWNRQQGDPSRGLGIAMGKAGWRRGAASGRVSSTSLARDIRYVLCCG